VNAAAGEQRPARRALVAGALLLALGTAIGAFGAHFLKDRLRPDLYAVLQTAVLYQFVNALGLLALGSLLERRTSRGLRIAAHLVLAGVLLFCCSLYALVAGAPRALGAITPFGGAALIAGWCVAALSILRNSPRA
jgi:uncharacterized membrane protein YgdD (TMEM256/DUF423 family)